MASIEYVVPGLLFERLQIQKLEFYFGSSLYEGRKDQITFCYKKGTKKVKMIEKTG